MQRKICILIKKEICIIIKKLQIKYQKNYNNNNNVCLLFMDILSKHKIFHKNTDEWKIYIRIDKWVY